jgi:hypothetical protein
LQEKTALRNEALFFFSLFHLADEVFRFAFAEKQGNAPSARKRDDRIDDAAEDGILTAEKPSDKVKLKKTDTAPVERTDDRENERDSIKHHIKLPFVKKWDGSTALIVSHGEKFYANTEKRD